MSYQSTNHIMMMEPSGFQSNPQTRDTNQYQHDNSEDVGSINAKAIQEFRVFRDALIENGVMVTSVLGEVSSPDDIFCNNWISTHAAIGAVRQTMVLYPMLAENRRIERRPFLLDMLKGRYDIALDLSAEEQKGRFLESTGSLAFDRINGVIYCALSSRTDEGLARDVADYFGYDIEFFETENHAGKPVYHTDVLMFIGSGYAGICSSCILDKDKDRILKRLGGTHEIIDLSMDQLRSFCGNALEVRGQKDTKMLVMSETAHNALTLQQKEIVIKYVDRIVYSDLSTIEKYGGGSARCMLLEMY